MPVGFPVDSEEAALLRRVTVVAVAVACLLIFIKLSAYFLTGSIALLSSLVDSVLDMFASFINLFAVRHSLLPADEEHRFGHGKAEPLAGLGQAAFISGSSVFICFEAVQRLARPVPVEYGVIGLLVMVISLAATVGLVLYQRSVIRATGSLAVQADSIHYISDIALNIGVILALVFSAFYGWVHADPLFALGIAFYIIYSAWRIARQSLDQLMDRELDEEDRKRIMEAAMQHSGVNAVHDLRTRASGQDRFIQLHMEVDGQLSLQQAHAIAVEVEKGIHSLFPRSEVIIHQDPV